MKSSPSVRARPEMLARDRTRRVVGVLNLAHDFLRYFFEIILQFLFCPKICLTETVSETAAAATADEDEDDIEDDDIDDDGDDDPDG